MNDLTLEQKVAQLFFIGLAGPELDDNAKKLLNDIPGGGVCLFARNIKEPRQTRHLLDDIRRVLPALPFLSVDQEGGLVDRLRRILSPMPAAAKLRDVDDAKEMAEIVADALLTLGFNMDFAPVVDVIDDERAKATNGLFSREFGRSGDDVSNLAGAFLRTLQSRGILGCLKHFPGLGASTVDSHEELPQVEIGEAELDRIDLLPYKNLLPDARAVMVAHSTYPGHSLQEKGQNGKLLPSSLSYNFITTLLRERLGFDGLVITDDLEMGAIIRNYGIGDACKMAINAGADMLAICNDEGRIREGYAAVLQAARDGEISDPRIDVSLARIDAVRSKLTAPVDLVLDDVAALSERICKLSDRLAANS